MKARDPRLRRWRWWCLLLWMPLLGGCSGVAVINALTPAGRTQTVESIAYGESSRQQLDIYQPEGAEGRAPVVVFFYGGTWREGERGDYRFVGRALASRGIVTVVADYRLYPEVRYPGFVEDSAQALAWSYRHIARYGGDPHRLFVMGHSAGAYNAAMVALDSRWLAAQSLSPDILSGWIGLAGPYDFLPITNADARPVFDWPNTSRDTQPIEHVSDRSPPALLLASHRDTTVNPERNTAGMARALRAHGVAVTEDYLDHTSHVTLIASLAWPLRWLGPALDDIDTFVHGLRSGANAGAQ
ncbi:Acetyl esterase/lipase [Kushneria avicenniae]|uniref:Acetyl esterase/lipase n=1 Tax=Kushneria avicenniae TaxID=402385 RepID=A0A1I1LPF4_9GAMM|nr:alpha/beta hydrolase [Kushneria avicenniae]SFC75107.1 Acetyl esterase/lipase [Kushneria avicenniae]